MAVQLACSPSAEFSHAAGNELSILLGISRASTTSHIINHTISHIIRASHINLVVDRRAIQHRAEDSLGGLLLRR